jgi:NitT/TauT family transport system substrate-binding protein
MGEGSAMNSAKYVMMLNRSQGADAMVVTKNIRTVADLKGKKIAVAEGTASHTLLLNILETNGISQHDVTLVKVDNGGAAADTFKAGQVDACVTWAPDDQACVDAIPGSRVLVSTKHAKDLVTDGLVGKAEWLDKNHDNVKKLISAILYANSTLNQNPNAVKEASKIFAKAFGTDPEFAELGCGNIWFATLGDEENFFGMTSDYMGMKAEEDGSNLCWPWTY